MQIFRAYFALKIGMTSFLIFRQLFEFSLKNMFRVTKISWKTSLGKQTWSQTVLPDYSWNEWDLALKHCAPRNWLVYDSGTDGVADCSNKTAWQDSFASHAVTGRGHHPEIGPWVCDGLTQTNIPMKQHCLGAVMPYFGVWWP